SVVELSARPGESVEPGASVLRVARFDRMLARVSLVPGERWDAEATEATVEVLGREDAPLAATPLRALPSVGPRPFGEAVGVAVEAKGFPLRAGMPVTARFSRASGATPGTKVPRAAVVRYLGRPWAYVDAGEKGFVRRALVDPRRLGDGWFVGPPWKAGESVV